MYKKAHANLKLYKPNINLRIYFFFIFLDIDKSTPFYRKKLKLKKVLLYCVSEQECPFAFLRTLRRLNTVLELPLKKFTSDFKKKK